MAFTREQRSAAFHAKYEVEESGCHTWTACRTRTGYGRFREDGKTVWAHRWAYEEANGPIPEGLTIDHLCRNRACVNPEHLEAVTQGENVRRGKALITHCPQGHAYDEENTANYTGSRVCLACNRERCRRYHHARAEVDRGDEYDPGWS